MMKNRLRAIAVAAGVVGTLALAALPAAAATPTVHEIDTWTNVTADLFYNGSGDFCTGQTVAGYPVESGWARATEQANGGFHVTGLAEGTLPLYEVTGPPWDVTWGEFVGTFHYSVKFDDQLAPGAHETEGSVMHGFVTYPDGTRQFFQVLFRIGRQPDGSVRPFLVKFVCGG